MSNLSLISLICILGVTGCSNNSQTNVESGTLNQVLHYANGDEPKSLDPHLTTGSPDNNIIMNLLEGLVSKDSKTLMPTPGVAESWTVSEDRKVYIFNLRANALWSNGDAVTAQDFVYSWRRALTPTFLNEYAYMMYYIKNAEAYHLGDIKDFSKVGVKALTQHTLEVTLDFPIHFFLQVLDHHSYYPVHRATIESHGGIDNALSKWTLPKNHVGNGAFTLKEWKINEVITLQKSGTYWGRDTVALSEVHIYPIEDAQAEERAYRSGMVHLTNTPLMEIEKIARYKVSQEKALRISPNYSSYFYEFNTTKKPFNDSRVRRAFAMAIDRDKIVKHVTKGGEMAAYSYIPNDPEGYQPKTHFKYDINTAQKLLSEAGYPNGVGFPVTRILYNTHNNHRKVAIAIQQMLKLALNVDIEIENKEWKVFMAARKSLEYDIARAGWLADYLDPSNFFDILRSYSGNNKVGWNSPSYDALMKQLDVTEDPSERFTLFEKANRLLAQEMPILPLYYYSDLNLVSPEVKGWFNNPMHYHPLKGVSLNALSSQ